MNSVSEVEELLEQLSEGHRERLLELVRFAETGMSASSVIHELRQPLTALSMSLQMTREAIGGTSATVEKGIQEALELTAKLEMLLSRAQEFMTPSDGPTDLDMMDCIRRVVSLLEWKIRGNRTLRMIVHPVNGPIRIRGDRLQIEQMLTNLVSNGIDAISETSGGTVHLLARCMSPTGVEIIVADDGCGLDTETRAHLFEPFYSTKGPGKGTGLGLFIVSKVAARHGALCAALSETELMELGLGPLTTGFSVRFSANMQE